MKISRKKHRKIIFYVHSNWFDCRNMQCTSSSSQDNIEKIEKIEPWSSFQAKVWSHYINLTPISWLFEFPTKSRQTVGRHLYVVTLRYSNYCIIITCIVQILRIQPGPKLRDHVMVGIKRYSPMSYWRYRCFDSK